MSNENFHLATTAEKTGYLVSHDGTKIFYRSYKNKNAIADILLVHGFGEHSGRYLHVVNRLLDEGFSVISFDLRGHGLSEGHRGDIKTFEHYENDLITILKKSRSCSNKSLPLFIVAHSMGSLISLGAVLKLKNEVSGLVLSSPLLGLSLKIAWWKRCLGHYLSGLAPYLPIKSEISGEYLSSDPIFANAYNKDPLILKSISIRAFNLLQKKLHTTNDLKQSIKPPFFMQIAGNDLVVDSNAAQNWFNKNSKKELDQAKIYPHFLHEIYNEKEREEAIGDLVSWLKQISNN